MYVPEIDKWAQARTDDEIELMARDLVAVWLSVPLSEVDVEVSVEA